MKKLTLLFVLVTLASTWAVDDVPLNHIQVLHAHNSYHQAPEPSIINIFRSQLIQSIASSIVDISLENAAQSLEYSYPSLTELLNVWGVRSFELDCFYDPEGGLFSYPAVRKISAPQAAWSPERLAEPGWKVLHIPDLDYNSSCLTLIDCLTEIRAWSEANPKHVPIFISIEPTYYDLHDLLGEDAIDWLNALLAEREGQPTELVSPLRINQAAFQTLLDEILSVFDPADMITVADIKQNASTLVQAITQNGWPLVSELRGRVLFIMSPTFTASLLRVYPELEGSPIFPSAFEDELHRDHTAFVAVNVRDPLLPSDSATWNRTVDREAGSFTDFVDQGYVVRGFTDYATLEARDSYTYRRDSAIAAGVHLLATDFPSGAGSRFFESDYAVELQTAAACNPRTADAACDAIATVPRAEPLVEATPPQAEPDAAERETTASLEMEPVIENAASSTRVNFIVSAVICSCLLLL